MTLWNFHISQAFCGFITNVSAPILSCSTSPDTSCLLYSCKSCSFKTAHCGALVGITAENTGSGAECASTGHWHLGDFQQAKKEEVQSNPFWKKMCWHCRNDKYWISIATNVALLCRHMVFRASFVQQVRLQWYGGKHALSIFMNFPVVVIFVNPVLVYCEIKHYGATYNAINELCVYHTIQHPQNYTQGK